jgi:ribosomal protein S18 acetylase RimI-like enzyme
MIELRHAEPADHASVIERIDDWWGGRPMAAMLPRLFFVHFRDTSFVAIARDEPAKPARPSRSGSVEPTPEEDGRLAGFLCGFRSQTFDDEAYVHFVGVDPALRGRGVARSLYERFFDAVRPRSLVRCVTGTVNEASVAFHASLGFEVERIVANYDGRGGDRVLLVKRL